MTPRAVLLTICLFLVACAPTVKPSGPDIGAPALLADEVRMTDGAILPLRHWLPKTAPRAVVLALHGFNDYSFAFDGPGQFLADHGIALYAYDQRGFGAAPERGYWAGEAALADDLDEVTRLVSARHPGVPLYLLGESMGGAVVMAAMTGPKPPRVAGVILSAPAVWSRDDMGIFQSAALWIASYSFPWLTLTGKGLDILPSDNLDMLRKLSADPMVIKETRVDAIHGLCDLMDKASLAAAHLPGPVLYLYGGKDEVVPAEPSLRAMAELPSRPGTVRALYGNGYHMLLRDLEAETVLGDIVHWIDAPMEPLPSGADRHAAERLASHAKEGA